MNCFLFAAEFVCGAKQIGIRVFSWNRVQKISNISFIKKTNSVAPSLYSSFFFPLLFLSLSTNIFLFASQFYDNSFVDFGTCCYTYNPSIVAVAKSSIVAVLFSPISKRFICLFFLLPHNMCREKGMTVVVITHNSALTPMADRVIRIKNGKVAQMTLNDYPTPVEEIEW